MAEGEGWVEEVTKENLDQFKPILREASESDASAGPGAGGQGQTGDAGADASEPNGTSLPEGLFDGERFPVTVGRNRPTRTSRPTRQSDRQQQEDEAPAPAGGPTGATAGRGPLLWRKPSLSATDAQRQTGHPTGSMRLTQAEWRVGGSVIDQTSYFRNDVFGNLDWEVGSRDPYREDAEAQFELTVRGSTLGQHELLITDKPSGEAGQGNYTTALHWRGLVERIRRLNVEGEPFELYGPPPGQDEPFFIVIG